MADVVPVRALVAEALARRAATHEGAVRVLLEARLAAWRAVGAEAERRDEPGAAGMLPTRPRPLAALLDQVAAQRPANVSCTSGPNSASVAPLDPATLAYFRGTWSRLHADRRWAQSQAALPENAGPLHSQHVAHRALTLMRRLSPDYFDRFIGYVDALLWLEQAQAMDAAGVPRAEKRQKGREGRPR